MADRPDDTPADPQDRGRTPHDLPEHDQPGGTQQDRELRDLVPLHALDALDDDERRAVDALVARDGAARRDLDEFREVVAAFTVEEAPPAHVRDKVFARLHAGRPELVSATETAPGAGEQDARSHQGVLGGSSPSRSISAAQTPTDTHPAAQAPAARTRHTGSRPRRLWTTLALAAVVVAAVAVPTALVARQEQRQLQEQADTVAAMLADPTARLLSEPMGADGAVTALVSGEDVLLSATGMTDPGTDSDYQLWRIDGDTISSLGVVTPVNGSASLLLEAGPGTVLAVTVEPKGGSEQPTTTPLVALQT